jgi:hypothetical protein
MTNDTHPMIRTITRRTGGEIVRATERHDKIQHLIRWTGEDDRDNPTFPKYAFDGRGGVSIGNPQAGVTEDGVPYIEAPIFMTKAAHPREFRSLSDGNPKWNWKTDDVRPNTRTA